MGDTNTNRIYYLLCIAALLVWTGCSNDLEPYEIVNIGDQYEIQMHQILSEDGGLPALQVNSIETQECINAHISYRSILTENKIEILLDNIVTEGDCVPGNVMISEEIPLGQSIPSIPIEIKLQDAVSNHGTLFSSESEMEILFSQFDGLKINKTRINRILPNMFWGSYTYSNENTGQQLAAYLKEIDNANSKLKGDYGHFYISPDDSVIIYNNNEENNLNFLITTEEDMDIIKSKFLEFKNLDPDLILEAMNYNGSALNIH